MKPDSTLLLVGAGARVGEVLLPALRRANLPLRVGGVVDPAPAAAGRITELDSVVFYPSLDQALATKTFDVALLACPHDLHLEAAQRLLAAGIAVWKEKPFALTPAEARALASVGGRLRVLAHRPHAQLYEIAARLSGAWGRLLSYRIRITRTTGDYSATWRADRARAGGGAVLDLGYHAFDLIARLASAPRSVYALTGASPTWRPAVEVEESAQLLLTHPMGTTGSVYVSRCEDRADVLDLVCEGGRITITDQQARIRTGDHTSLVHTVDLTAQDDPWARMLRHHARTFDDPATDAAEADIGLTATAIMHAAYASIASGCPEAPEAAPLVERTA